LGLLLLLFADFSFLSFHMATPPKPPGPARPGEIPHAPVPPARPGPARTPRPRAPAAPRQRGASEPPHRSSAGFSFLRLRVSDSVAVRVLFAVLLSSPLCPPRRRRARPAPPPFPQLGSVWLRTRGRLSPARRLAGRNRNLCCRSFAFRYGVPGPCSRCCRRSFRSFVCPRLGPQRQHRVFIFYIFLITIDIFIIDQCFWMRFPNKIKLKKNESQAAWFAFVWGWKLGTGAGV